MNKLEITNNRTKRELNNMLDNRESVDLRLSSGALCWLHRPQF